MSLRRKLTVVHKWTGLVIAAFLIVQSITGLMLVYRAEIHTFLAGGEPTRTRDRDEASLEQIVIEASKQNGYAKVSRVVYPTLAGQPYTVYLNDVETMHVQRIVAVYAGSGQSQVGNSMVPTAFDAIFRLHHVLLLDNVVGRYAVGVTGLVLAAMLLTGLYIWWPGIARLQNSLRITRYRNPVTFFWQVHRTIGVLGFLLVLLTASSGILLAFGPELRSTFVAEPLTATDASGKSCDSSILDKQLRSAKTRFPDSRVRDVRFSDSSDGLARVLFVNRTQAGVGPPHQVWLEPCSTVIMAVNSGIKRPDADGVLSWTYPIHTGIALGHPGRLLSLFAGMAILASVTTGVLLWSSRNRLKSAKRLNRSRR